ncbi:MAG TPA: choice-of-anchor L domain-containing protein, partial [Saprospiraceae bacterium]|nr:choice-of-anchor L domain-containing protein [Saprospiraceae bacterium]
MRSFLLACCTLLCATASLFAQTPSVSVSFADAQRRHRIDVPAGQVRMEMCGLTLGHTYRVLANPAFERQADKPTLSLERGAAPASDQRPHQLTFTAYAPCMDLWLDVPTGPEGASVPLSISASCADCPDDRQASQEWLQKFKEKVGAPDMAPLQVSAGTPAANLVRNVLIGGDCFDVTNITTSGNSNSRGTFSNGTSSISIANGVVLSSGHVNELPGPNTFSDADGGFNVNSTNDPDLNKLSTGDQFDLSRLEFDFVPTANTLRFEFVFGSEEYCEFVGSQYNDVFGFFISGPGIAGTLNIGLIPGTSTPVTINNVNHNKNSTYYINNRLDPLNCVGWPPTAFNDIELDGYTKVFTATANVQPCQKYHIKLAIADIQDERYCSAVFLKANSFNAGGQVEAEPVYANSQPNALENCGQSFIRFKRSAGDVNVALPVSYSIAPQSTAQVGLDFSALPTNVVIPAGQTEVLVPVSLFQDGITEGQEKIVISLNNSCTCTEQKVEFLLNDRPLLDAALTDEAVCGGAPALLEPAVSGGLAPITYLWNTGQTSANISVTPSAATTYSVTVSDACGSSQVLSSQVSVQNPPSAALSGGGVLCTPGSSTELSLSLSGQSPW